MAGLTVEIAPVLVLVLVVALYLWIYSDAKLHVERGKPVAFYSSAFVIETPAAWVMSCALLSFVFIPLYLTLRRQAG